MMIDKTNIPICALMDQTRRVISLPQRLANRFACKIDFGNLRFEMSILRRGTAGHVWEYLGRPVTPLSGPLLLTIQDHSINISGVAEAKTEYTFRYPRLANQLWNAGVNSVYIPDGLADNQVAIRKALTALVTQRIDNLIYNVPLAFPKGQTFSAAEGIRALKIRGTISTISGGVFAGAIAYKYGMHSGFGYSLALPVLTALTTWGLIKMDQALPEPSTTFDTPFGKAIQALPRVPF